MRAERRKGLKRAPPKCRHSPPRLAGSVRSPLCPRRRWTQDPDRFKLVFIAAGLHDPPVTFSSAISLTPFLRSSARGGSFLTNVSLNPPTQTPTAPRDWQKKKKRSGLYTNSRKCFKPSSHLCDLWNVTRLRSFVIRKPELSGEMGQVNPLRFPEATALTEERERTVLFPTGWRWRRGNSDGAIGNDI